MKKFFLTTLIMITFISTGSTLIADSKIIYSSNEGGNYDIYSIVIDKDLNIVEKIKLTDWSKVDHWPYWSNDGRQIAYGSYVGGARQLFIMKEDGSGKHQITNTGLNSTPRKWSINGKFIYGNHSSPGGGDIAKYDIESKTIEMLTYVPGMNTQRMDLNKDQSRIVFVRGRKGNGWTNDLYVADFRIEDYDFTNKVKLEAAEPSPHDPKYSPDQKKIALILMSYSPRWDSLALINPDGTGFQELIRFNNKSAAFPEWLNNDQIILSMGNKYNMKLHIYDLRDNSLTQITFESGNHIHPSAKDISPTQVLIDIKPGSDTNPINLGSNGNTPVAIFGSNKFDVTTIIPESLRLVGAGLKTVGKSKMLYSFDDVNYDGFIDMVAHFTTKEMELTINDTEAVMTGLYGNNKKFRGSDVVDVLVK